MKKDTSPPEIPTVSRNLHKFKSDLCYLRSARSRWNIARGDGLCSIASRRLNRADRKVARRFCRDVIMG